MGLIKPIPKDKKRGWKVEIEGVEKTVSHIRISSPNFGDFNYGLTPPGYDGWSFHELGGGGVVSVPFAKVDGSMLVGLVEQVRHNQGGRIWNLPRGFMNPGQSHFEALAAELAEELGYLSPEKRLKKLGPALNPNSAFFETAEPGEGVKFCSVEILADQLESEAGGYRFKAGQMKPVSKAAELIFQCRFLPWRKAMEVGDMFTVAGIGLLIKSEICW